MDHLLELGDVFGIEQALFSRIDIPGSRTGYVHQVKLHDGQEALQIALLVDRDLDHVSDAAEHDSQVLDDILDGDNTALAVWADSAYRSAEIAAALKEKGLRSRIHRKGRRNKPLSEREKQGNKTRSSVRVRVEHVFGAQSNDMGGTLVRSVGLVRAKARIGLKNLAYNMRRLVQLERLAAAV